MLLELEQRTMVAGKEPRSKAGSVFLLPSTELLFDESVPDYPDQGASWTFDSYQTREAARKAMQEGSPNQRGTDAYDKARLAMNETIDEYRVKSIRRKRVFDEAGDEPCIDRYLVGESRLWGQMRKTAKNRCVTVGLSMWMSCGNAESDFAENIANGVALAEMLASAGYLIRVVGVHTIHARTNGIRGFVHPMVEFGKPIDEHALMAWGQPAACRYLGFKWMQALYSDSDMGTCETTPEDWLAMAGVDIFMAKQWGDGNNPEAHKAHLKKVLERVTK